MEAGPGVDTDKPVSRRLVALLFTYNGYPYYWTGPFAWGAAPYPMPAMAASAIDLLIENAKTR